ncbi:hypothetical protein ACFLQN_04425 [Candidatus Aenigmatarchaeota archaeon]
MLQHDLEEKRNPWIMSGVAFIIIFIFSNALYTDIQLSIMISLLIAGILFIVHEVLSHHVSLHNNS